MRVSCLQAPLRSGTTTGLATALKGVAKRAHLAPPALMAGAVNITRFNDPEVNALLCTRSRSVPAQHCV